MITVNRIKIGNSNLGLFPTCLLALSFLAFFSGCDEQEVAKEHFLVEANNYIYHDASPILYAEDTTYVFLQDFVPDYEAIESFSVTGGLNASALNDSVILLTGKMDQQLAVLNLEFPELSNAILIKSSGKQEISLSYSGKGKSFGIKGDFNAWNPASTPVNKTSDGFEIAFKLSPGRYQYLFIVDGKELKDPANNDSISNGVGGWNSLIEVPGPDESKLPLLTTTNVLEGGLELVSSNTFDEVFVFWQNFRLEEPFVQSDAGSIKISIPEEAKLIDRSSIRVWAMNEEGVSNQLYIPLNEDEVLASTNELRRQDWHSSVMYFMMIDRFFNGNAENDEKVDDPDIHPKANYYGGDLAGITAKIKEGYFESLGFNTLWLSPITQNPKGAYGKYPNPPTKFSGYHGYWPVSSSKVDYRYGTSDELKELLGAAHQNDMNVILDYVANHIHEEHPLYKEYPEWATSLYLEDSTLNTQLWDEQRLTTWFDTFMPTLDLRQPAIVDPLTDSALFWLTNYDFDGFRHDATKHIDLLFWRELTKKIKLRVLANENRTIYQVGETYGSRELIASYINSGMLDAQFDFNLYSAITNAFGKPDADLGLLAAELKESLNYYGDHHLMVNITGNQDKARFISLADGSLDWGEDHKLAGWTREIDNQGEEGFQRLAGLTAFTFAIPGIPCLYYGDEIGMPGGNDPDNRRMMQFEGLNENQEKHKANVQKIIQLRRENLALIYGTTEILQAKGNQMVLKRKYFGNEVLVVFNMSTEPAMVDLTSSSEVEKWEVNFNGKISTDNDRTTLALPPLSFEFLINN
jgi:glycosidase